MLKFTRDQMDVMGPGILVPDGDVLYITNNIWLIAVTGVEQHFPIELLRMIANPPSRSLLLDWRSLEAETLYLQDRKYLPLQGSIARDLYVPITSWPRSSPEAIRGFLEKSAETIWGDNYSLNEYFDNGLAITQYLKQEIAGNERRAFATSPGAEHYTFDLDGRILTVNAGLFRAFHELGFEITCPKDTVGPPQFLGLHHQTEEPVIFGYLAPVRESGVNMTSDNRPLYLDAGIASWYSVEEGLAQLQATESYEANQLISATSRAADKMSDVPKTLRAGVSILRWKGWDDEEINKAHGLNLGVALEELAQKLDDKISNYYHEVERNGFPRYSNVEHVLLEMSEELACLELELGRALPREHLDYLLRKWSKVS